MVATRAHTYGEGDPKRKECRSPLPKCNYTVTTAQQEQAETEIGKWLKEGGNQGKLDMRIRENRLWGKEEKRNQTMGRKEIKE